MSTPSLSSAGTKAFEQEHDHFKVTCFSTGSFHAMGAAIGSDTASRPSLEVPGAPASFNLCENSGACFTPQLEPFPRDPCSIRQCDQPKLVLPPIPMMWLSVSGVLAIWGSELAGGRVDRGRHFQVGCWHHAAEPLPFPCLSHTGPMEPNGNLNHEVVLSFALSCGLTGER